MTYRTAHNVTLNTKTPELIEYKSVKTVKFVMDGLDSALNLTLGPSCSMKSH